MIPQSQIGKDIQKLRMYSGTYPTALDMWFAVVALIIAFGHSVPWWVWVLGTLEFVSIVLKAVEYRMTNKET